MLKLLIQIRIISVDQDDPQGVWGRPSSRTVLVRSQSKPCKTKSKTSKILPSMKKLSKIIPI